MTTATIFVRNHNLNLIKCRALLDTCASANFISQDLAKLLNLPISPCTMPIGAINSITTLSKGVVQINILSVHNEFSKRLSCLMIPKISDLVPSEIFPRDFIKIPSNIKLADPEFHLPRPVDLLIGSGATLSLFSIGQIDLSREGHDLYLQKIRLGWVVAGGSTSQSSSKKFMCQLTSLDQQIAKFWSIEEIGIDSSRSAEELECELHFEKNTSRNFDGRYTVRLPFRKYGKSLGNSRTIALKRLNTLERKLDSDITLKTAYSQVIQECLDLKHMSSVNDTTINDFTCRIMQLLNPLAIQQKHV